MKQIIVVAGASGDLGHRIVNALLDRGADVRVILRGQGAGEKSQEYERRGVGVFKINAWSVDEISPACAGAACVVSALAGLRDVVSMPKRFYQMQPLRPMCRALYLLIIH